jgi:hypothetical protein
MLNVTAPPRLDAALISSSRRDAFLLMMFVLFWFEKLERWKN